MDNEIEILCSSYTQQELAEQLLLAIEVIREKNKLLENQNETKKP
jgi:hypothetical protein